MTKKSNSRTDTVRAPMQKRSQERVDQIMEAAKALILEHGCAGLKMGDIAKTANVSIASIYQYYPNKQAIVAALASHYADILREHVFNTLSEVPEDVDSLWLSTLPLIDDAYNFHRDDLVVRDIWNGSNTDKSLRDLTTEDTEKHLEFYFNKSKHLFKPSKHDDIKMALSLLMDFAKSAIYQSIELDEKAGRKKMNMAKKLLTNNWEASIKPMARASRKR